MRNRYDVIKDGEIICEMTYAEIKAKYGLASSKVHTSSTTGRKYHGLVFRAQPKMMFAVSKGEKIVFVGSRNGATEFLRSKGISYASNNIYYLAKSGRCVEGYVVSMVEEGTAVSSEEETDYASIVIQHLERYGNTIICGENRDAILKQLKKMYRLDVRQVHDRLDGTTHYVIERK